MDLEARALTTVSRCLLLAVSSHPLTVNMQAAAYRANLLATPQLNLRLTQHVDELFGFEVPSSHLSFSLTPLKFSLSGWSRSRGARQIRY